MARPKGSKNIKKGPRKPVKTLSTDQVARMIKEWDEKTVPEWADEFGVSNQTISKLADTIHKEDNKFCPPKPRKRRTREDLAKSAIAMVKKEMGKK